MLGQLGLSFNSVNMVIMRKNGLKYQYAGQAVCAKAHIFHKRPGCALIGACALIRMNMVCSSDICTFAAS